jgi:NAD(P)-dependent dehydrogenase (short-subunit alcohol dehydrogenase family)
MILKDRVALVTAAGSGIGRGGAEIMGREGAIVIATDLVAERAEETARRIRDAGGRAEARQLDVTKDSDIQRLIDYAATSYGRIDTCTITPASRSKAPWSRCRRAAWTRATPSMCAPTSSRPRLSCRT